MCDSGSFYVKFRKSSPLIETTAMDLIHFVAKKTIVLNYSG